MTRGPVVVSDPNLSRAWARAFLELCRRGTSSIVPLIATVIDLEHGIQEDPEIRGAVDDALRTNGMKSVRTTASTIFPASMWRREAQPSSVYDRYLAAYPRIRHADRANQYGTYFHRMIAYQPDGIEQPVNQLNHILTTYAGENHRRSALQVVIFDPTRDHTNQRQRGFPCLHQVAFSPMADGKLAVTGFYGTQHLFRRGYGNYVGLCQLSEFMAHGMGLQLSRVTCIAAVAELGIQKQVAEECESSVRKTLGVKADAEPESFEVSYAQ